MEKGKQIIKKLQDYKKQDFSYLKGNILGSMCTQPHSIAKKAYFEFFETNLGDPKIFPGTQIRSGRH